MKRIFANIEEFFSVRERCVFCQEKLKIVFINFSRAADDIPIIKAKVKDNKFSFNLKHISDSFELDADVQIDIKTNALKFDIPNVNTNDPIADYWIAQSVFENLGPHVELYCPNKKCKMKYHICSDTFKLIREMETDYENANSWGDFHIKSVKLYMESFVISKLWVQNDWILNSTNIFSRNDTDINPIKTNILDLESMGKDKIINRIKTLVTFS